MKELIQYIKDASILNLNNILYGDVYNILNSDNINYGACVLEIENSQYVGSIHKFNIRFTIVDKLTEDESNLLDIYDNCTRQLNDLRLYLLERYDVDGEYTINYIKLEFADKLAGVYATISVNDLKMFCSYE